MHIAFFDSGIGGLTVLRDALKILPQENYIYYADTKNVPYGTKSKEVVIKFILEAVDFLVGKNIKMLVLACNTATSVAAQELRKRYSFPIIGMEPAVKPAVENSKEKRVLVLATTLTLREEKLENLIKRVDRHKLVDKMAFDELVGFAENGNFESIEVKRFIKEKLGTVDLSLYGFIVLGCTHFIYFRDLIRSVIPPDISIIDGNMGTVRNIKATLETRNLLNSGKGKVSFYFSGKMVDSQEELKRLYHLLNYKHEGL